MPFIARRLELKHGDAVALVHDRIDPPRAVVQHQLERRQRAVQFTLGLQGILQPRHLGGIEQDLDWLTEQIIGGDAKKP